MPRLRARLPVLGPASGLALTANALRPVTRTRAAAAWAFVFGWHVSELPLATLGAQTLGTARFLRRHGWRTRKGRAALASLGLSAAGLVALQRSAQQSEQVLEGALVEGLGPDYRKVIDEAGLSVADGPPVNPWMVWPPLISRRHYIHESGVLYGPEGKRNRLDIWRRPDLPVDGRAPVLMQVPGGGWVMGESRHQAYPLMQRLVEAGWVCVPINYRLSPKATFPDHVVDVKRAIAWVKANIADYGGDPNFIAITGGSAGGHLSSLAALSANEPDFQPGFEDADTSVQAAVPFYGAGYTLNDWDGKGGPKQSIRHVQKYVLKCSPLDQPELWKRAGPVNWCSDRCPPIMVIHGTNDSLVPVESARTFVETVRGATQHRVVYAELPMAQHAFDIYASLRTVHTVRAVERFLAYVRAQAATSQPTVEDLSSANDVASASA